MKKSTHLLCSLAILAGLTGCERRPGNAAKTFLDDLSAGKFTEAKKLATAELYPQIDYQSNMAHGGFFGMTSADMHADRQFSLVDERIQGDKALVTLHSGKFNYDQSVGLQKVDGHWMVYLLQTPMPASATDAPQGKSQTGVPSAISSSQVGSKRTAATKVLENLRIIDSATDQWAIESCRLTGQQATCADLFQYLRKDSPLFKACKAAGKEKSFVDPDTPGVIYHIKPVDTVPSVSGVSGLGAPVEFWSPYQLQ